jgi:hypothetical protein
MQIGLEFFDLCIRTDDAKSSPGNKRSFLVGFSLSPLFIKAILIPISSVNAIPSGATCNV